MCIGVDWIINRESKFQNNLNSYQYYSINLTNVTCRNIQCIIPEVQNIPKKFYNF